MRCLARALRAAASFSIALALLSVGCAEDGRIRLLDAEGPRGMGPPPGPWGIAVLTAREPPRVWWAVNGADFAELPLEPVGQGQFVGQLPPAGPGTVFTWYAELGPERLPPAGAAAAYRFAVVADPRTDAAPPNTCRLAFTRPTDGQTVFEATDDNAPQARTQLTVRVGTDLPPGSGVRLTVGEATYTGRVGIGEVDPGEVAFGAVTLNNGEQTLVADALAPDGGVACTAEINVQVVPRR